MKTRFRYIVSLMMFLLVVLGETAGADDTAPGLVAVVVVDTSPSTAPVWDRMMVVAEEVAAALEPGDRLELVTAHRSRPRLRASLVVPSTGPTGLTAFREVLTGVERASFWDADVADALHLAYQRLDDATGPDGDEVGMCIVLSDGRLSDREVEDIGRLAAAFEVRSWPLLVTGTEDSSRRLLVEAAEARLRWVSLQQADPRTWLAEARAGARSAARGRLSTAQEGSAAELKQPSTVIPATKPALSPDETGPSVAHMAATEPRAPAEPSRPSDDVQTLPQSPSPWRSVIISNYARLGDLLTGAADSTESLKETVQPPETSTGPPGTINRPGGEAETPSVPPEAAAPPSEELPPPEGQARDSGPEALLPKPASEGPSTQVAQEHTDREADDEEQPRPPTETRAPTAGQLEEPQPARLAPTAAEPGPRVPVTPEAPPAAESAPAASRWPFPPLAVAAFGGVLAVVLALLVPDLIRVARLRKKRRHAEDGNAGEKAFLLLARVNGRDQVLGPLDGLKRFHVGSGPQCMVRVTAEGVADHHLRAFRRWGRWRLHNLTREPVEVNGLVLPGRRSEKVTFPCLLQLTDKAAVRLFLRPVSPKLDQEDRANDSQRRFSNE